MSAKKFYYVLEMMYAGIEFVPAIKSLRTLGRDLTSKLKNMSMKSTLKNSLAKKLLT